MKAFLKSPDSILALRPKITLIGRHEDADIILKSTGIEDHHAALEFSEAENGFVLRDFNSAQGTFVNDCQIQNAAVKVGPGDILRFGPNGAAFELVLDNAPQVSYPPVNRRLAWPGPLQIVTETQSPPATTAPSQFPSLPSQYSPPVSRSWSYVPGTASPHPPRRKKPINAWGRAVTSPSFSPDAFPRPSAVVRGDGGATGPLTNIHQGETLLKERDEVILKLGNEIARLSAFESECNRKDLLIANLQNEIAAMTDKLAAAVPQREADFHQKLLGLEEEVAAKAGEIKTLREQINTLQKNTSEVLYHSLSERDLQIAHWKQETETLKKSYSLTTGLVTSLQKDVTWKDQKIQQLKMDAEKLKRENREKDNQLAHISAQCSRIKEETKRELREREVNAYENHITELELQVQRSEDDMKKCRAEQDALASQLVEKTKAEGELREECERKAQQLQEMGRRERLIKSDMDLVATQAQCFRSQIAEILFFQLPEKSVTDQQIVEKIKQIQAANVEYCQKEMELREEMHVNESEMEEMMENVETLKKSLDGFQDFLKTPYCGNSLRKEIASLQNICLMPPASDVQASIAKILGSLHTWVDATEGLLQDVGLDVSGCEKGMSSYMKQLLDQHRNTLGLLQTLQDRLKMAEESQETILQERLKELKEKLEEEFQSKEKEDLEVEKEHRKVLEGMAALEEAKWTEAIGEAKKKVEDLETQAKQLSEALEQKAKSEAATKARVTEALESLEAAERRKTLAEEKLTVCEKRLKSLEKENETQKRKHQEETSEYKEQVKQHSRTIVDLESKYAEAARSMKKAKEENGNLQKQIEEMQRKSCRSLPACLQEAVSPEESHDFWKEELRAARRKILSGEAVVAELKKELSEARARVSDAMGELSEKQKMELEQKQSLVRSQGHEIIQLREKLLEMSNLVDQKDSDLKIVRGELRNSREKLKEVTKKTKEKAEKPEKDLQHKETQTQVPSPDESPAARKGTTWDLAGIGARCKGSRHEEIIHRQKDALVELRQRIRVLEKACPLDFEHRTSEPLIVVKKSPMETRERKTEKEQVTGLVIATDANKLQRSISSIDPNVSIERTSKLEMADALDLSENMYFTLIQDLARLVNVKELVGMETVMYLPHDERERVKTLRQKDLGLLFEKVSQLKSCLERKESLLKEYEKDLGKLRTNKQTLQACQSEIAKLGDRLYQESEEKALLKEALERTKLQLTQERRLNRALKHNKNHLEEKRNKISPCHSCTQKFRDGKTASPKKPFPEARKTLEKPAAPCEKRVQRSGSA